MAEHQPELVHLWFRISATYAWHHDIRRFAERCHYKWSGAMMGFYFRSFEDRIEQESRDMMTKYASHLKRNWVIDEFPTQYNRCQDMNARLIEQYDQLCDC